MALETSSLLASIDDAARTMAEVSTHVEVIAAIAGRLAEMFTQGGKLLACGNGGSAADAQHLTGEWVGRFVRDRRSYPAIALTADSALLTCLGNDYGYADVFARQIEGLGCPGDLLIGFSTSGNSENVVKAVLAGRSKGLVTAVLLGRDGGRLHGLADYEIVVHSAVTARIQEAHALIVHLLCEETERLLGHG
jgi:D-sedoheptulose 7-phosphate isomerase